MGAAPTPVDEPANPAVSIRASVKPDYIVCLEDGKKLKMLKRHLMTRYQMTPADYPMVAPNYAEQRRTLAHMIGLGLKPKAKEPTVPPEGTDTSKPRGRRKKLAIRHPIE